MSVPAENVTHLRVPPHSIEAEQSVLGAILQSPDCLPEIDLSAEEFYRTDHRLIYRAILECGAATDIVLLAEALEKAGELEAVGGLPYLSTLSNGIGTTANVGRYADVIRQRAKLRSGITAAQDAVQAGFDGDADGMFRAMSEGLLATESDSKQEFWDARSSLAFTIERIQRVSDGEEIPGIPFGIKGLDEKYPAGMKPGNLIVLGGRPSMGKTAVMLNMVLSSKVPVGVMTFEMSHDELTQRELTLLSRVNYTKLDTADLTDQEWSRVTQAATDINNRKISIYDRGGVDIGEVCRAAMRMKHRDHIEVLFVDYLQLISGEGNNRAEEIGQITRRLKGLAKQLHIPIVLGSQLSRKVDDRKNHRPIMSDLRESGQIEQDADMVIFLYRRAMYEDCEDTTMEFLVEKARNNAVSTVYAGWDAELMMLKSREVNSEYEEYQ